VSPRPTEDGEVQQGFVGANLKKVGDSVEGVFRATSAGPDAPQTYFVVDDDGIWQKLPGYSDLSNQLWRLAAEARRGKFVNQFWVRVEMTGMEERNRTFTVTKWPYDTRKQR
jgi:hypothetical protein